MKDHERSGGHVALTHIRPGKHVINVCVCVAYPHVLYLAR